MENQVTVYKDSSLAVPPATVISEAKIAVNVFKGVIELKPKKVIINNEQYLEYEDWQTLGEFYRCSAVTREAVPVEVDRVKGAKAKADLVNIDTGVIIGGAEAYCMRDEEKWSTRPKYEWQGEGNNRKKVKVGDEPVPWFQLASMAQTRAGAKAYRNRLAWVAVMAGYRPTPAEEMTGKETHTESDGHWCSIHNVPFFKKGKMKSYAHKIEGTDQWCNEPEVVEGEVVDEPSAKKELTPGQKLAAAMKETGYTNDEVKAHMAGKYGRENSKDLTVDELKELTSDVLNYQVAKPQQGEDAQEELFPEDKEES